ncbi:hypothetical protein J422_05953 [Methanocaldococcus villosus KIN24-T80]|uniref:Cysteine-rich small domain-containing protein n=1 Tax=Methanocaldococcus villosus KIN24-T80 TaxID=1069083 RepID=N6UTV5_9EURY|nr:cysteine-rich small domain-containing protein [Methanocaldococcus villosus]ENN95779.1 hypothetical protein J422_05953 [Methanocaldococcus villosus KIN24-T80]
MIKMAEDFFRKLFNIVINKSCPYYPCHFDGQTCIWCFCPFYPCEDQELGKYIERKDGSKVWSCENCWWIHREDVACEVLKEILKLVKDKDIDEMIEILKDHKLMLEIKEKVKERVR